MNVQVILTATALLTLTLAAGVPTIASVPYLGNVGIDGETGANTLEEVLKIKSEQVILVDSIKYQHPGVGTVLPTHGVPIDAFMILSALFGIIAAVFFIRGRSGKYATVRRM